MTHENISNSWTDIPDFWTDIPDFWTDIPEGATVVDRFAGRVPPLGHVPVDRADHGTKA